MTAVIAAAATFVVMITIATQLPDLPGPLLFILPAGVFGVVESLFRHFHFDERRRASIDRASAWLAAAVCVGFVWASLASPTHLALRADATSVIGTTLPLDLTLTMSSIGVWARGLPRRSR